MGEDGATGGGTLAGGNDGGAWGQQLLNGGFGVLNRYLDYEFAARFQPSNAPQLGIGQGGVVYQRGAPSVAGSVSSMTPVLLIGAGVLAVTLVVMVALKD